MISPVKSALIASICQSAGSRTGRPDTSLLTAGLDAFVNIAALKVATVQWLRRTG